jgi:hypothetical protein
VLHLEPWTEWKYFSISQPRPNGSMGPLQGHGIVGCCRAGPAERRHDVVARSREESPPHLAR